MAYANGKKAWGISDRSGRRYRLHQMKVEWTGAKVGPDEFEPKHPQLYPPKVGPDPQALRNPRPDKAESLQVYVGVPTVEAPTLERIRAIGAPGEVSVIGTTGGANATPTGVSATGGVGTAFVDDVSFSVTGVSGTSAIGSVTVTTTGYTTYTVTVASGTNSYGTGNKYYIGGSVSPTLSLNEGNSYRFDQSDSSNSSHPFRFSTTANGSHGGGSEYTTGVTTSGTPGSAGAYTQITVASGAPTLYYYCTNHSGMGGQANTP